MTATSKVTAKGRVTVPSAIRHKLGLAPGTTLVWHVEDGQVVVRRAGVYTSEEIHSLLFDSPPPTTSADVRVGLRNAIRRRHARR